MSELPVIPKRPSEVKRLPRDQFIRLAAASPRLANWVSLCVGSHVAAVNRVERAERISRVMLGRLQDKFVLADAMQSFGTLDRKQVANWLTWLHRKKWIVRVGNNRAGHWEKVK